MNHKINISWQVEIEEEKEYNEVVEEVVKRLVKNDLYVKAEKYKWKVRKVKLLGVVIGLEGIKIEKWKVKTVLDWPFPKSVKEVQKFLGLANYYSVRHSSHQSGSLQDRLRDERTCGTTLASAYMLHRLSAM